MHNWELSNLRLGAFAIALGFVVVLVVVVGVVSKSTTYNRWFLGALVSGSDGRLSTSKFQAVIWTAVALFGFVEVFTERLLVGVSAGDSTIPVSMLIAMGFSAVTMTAAKGITVSYVTNGLVNKEAPAAQRGRVRPKLGGLVTDDDGVPELAKIQMLAFTTIAVVFYLVRMSLQESVLPALTDIEPSLMALMGLSQGAYLGKKLTTTETPKVTGISPAMGRAGDIVKLTGISFGAEQDGNVVTVDGTPVPEVTAWTDKEIKFKLPAERSPAVAWKDGDRATVAIVANGREASALTQFVYSATVTSSPVPGANP
ncbi:MAG: hypothetical protein JWP01_3972 [Myxococcales bacterium]|nr:hypothetical protein [Myxococcales bacterium]